MEQTSIFDLMYPKFKIDKPIRLIEFFSGYGSQALALKYLNIPFTHHKTCEWAIKSIQTYKDIHFPEDNKDYSKDLDIDTIKKYLYEKGISSNYNEPMSEQQVNRLGAEQARTIYNNIQATHNLVNIQQVKGKDLEIADKDKYCYILTYSFPCQDLSVAGKGKGMSDTSTRSGMLWEVERILTECKELGTLPQCLLMENVPQVHSQDNLKAWERWLNRLEELGYKNYFKDLIATDYGIPQTRNRCFMISILGDYSYTFPKPIPLKLKLKDLLEDNVDDKYYLPEKYLENIEYYNENKNQIAYLNYSKQEQSNRVWNIDKVSPTLCASFKNDYMASVKILIKNATKKGYLEAQEGDGIDISGRMEYHRDTVQKNKTQTISTMGGENNGVVLNDLRIRKLTPRECYRLMGVKDEDYDKVKTNQSDSSLYHLAGDSIVVNVLMSIFKELL